MNGRMLLLITGYSLAFTGCVVPIPHRRMHYPGVTGRVRDAISHAAIPAARIQTVDAVKQAAILGYDGVFTLKPVYGWHGASLIGPIGLSLFPGFDVPSSSRNFVIEFRGD